jgi:2'-5' RNA ligase
MEKGSCRQPGGKHLPHGEFTGPVFVAIPLPADGLEILSSFVAGNAHLKSVRWIPRANYHVTLLYIGSVQKEAMPAILRVLREVLAILPAFELTFTECSVIRKKGRENMIWARYRDDEQFSLCSLKIREALSPLADIQSGFLKPLPHTTLARLKNPEAVEEVVYPAHLPGFTIPVRHCELWETNRAEKGVWYRRIEAFTLCSS